jgi:hypothetical protein
MKKVIVCMALAFLAVGCATDPDSSVTQDEMESHSTQAVSTDGIEAPAATAALNCSAPVLTCRDFCTCQHRECLASGGIPSLCRAELDGCIRDLCR